MGLQVFWAQTDAMSAPLSLSLYLRVCVCASKRKLGKLLQTTQEQRLQQQQQQQQTESSLPALQTHE